MILFAQLVAEKWNISESLAATICTSYEQRDWPYYLHDYVPAVAAEVELTQLWEIYDFLDSVAALGPKKKRLINALKKDGVLDEVLERRINLSIDSFELDDMLIAHRPNPRSRAQVAIQMGLGTLADEVVAQEDEEGTLEERAEKYVGTHGSLKSADDVIKGVKDILAERFAYDETVRAMAREFCLDDGYFTVQPKNRKDNRFASYRDRELPVQEIGKEDLLKLLAAEERKQIRLRLGVQLFRITEVLRQHFIENPDAFGFDIICEAIDDAWQRLLHSAIERDIKERLGQSASSWALRSIFEDLLARTGDKGVRNLVAVSMTRDGRTVCAGLNSEGRLLGASRDHRPLGDKTSSDTLAKLLTRYRPAEVVAIRTEDGGEQVEAVVRTTLGDANSSAEITVIDDPSGKTGICESEWVKTKCADLDRAMRHVYAAALTHVSPLTLVSEIGAEYFEVHPLQQIVPKEALNTVISRVATQRGLSDGIPARDVADSVLVSLPDMPEELPQAIRSRDIAEPLAGKADLLSVEGMTERIYRNIAGYVVLPVSSYALDTTLVHPYFYDYMEEMARDLKVSTEGMVVNPGVLNAYTSGDFNWQLYVRKHVMRQLAVGQKVAQTRQLPRRKLRLDELEEGMIVQGKVTNISPFGAFVNINAVCDGLIHISQLADTYVENPEQVVSVGDTVNVRIVKVDTKKRRISLSMKGQGQTPRVRPSANHITNLIDHFSNR